MITCLAGVLLAASLALPLYAYVGYPLILKLAGSRSRRRRSAPGVPAEWPSVSITVPAYNEAATIAATLRRILALDYPADRRQILVVSDASTDGTDEIVRGFAAQGVELLRMPVRRGKTAAENAALRALRGEIIVNADAAILIAPDALRPLIAAFADPAVGVASGRDVSVAVEAVGRTASHNAGESGYVGYEMWVRGLETALPGGGGIIGASGCFYAIRAAVHRTHLPDALSRDFAAALVAREQGFRAVSVPDAVCFVPRTASLHREYRRKVRTMTRGMQTLRYKKHLLNPGRFGLFAWMLLSHKVCRWLVPWAGVTGLAALAVLSVTQPWARWVLAVAGAVMGAALLGWLWPERRPLPRMLALPAYVVSGNVAALAATLNALRGGVYATWEPTRREPAPSAAPHPAVPHSGA